MRGGPGGLGRASPWRRAVMALVVVALFGAQGAVAASADDPAPFLAAAARTILGAGQGVYVEASDGTVLVAQAAERAVHPASVSKVPSTLAMLSKLGPDYRFTTRFAWSAPAVEGVLDGDVSVTNDGDPTFVDEDALLIAARFNDLGIRRIAGTLRLNEPLIFDWQRDPRGLHLERALSGRTADAAWLAVRELETGQIRGASARGRPGASARRRPAVTFTSTSTRWRGAHVAHVARVALSSTAAPGEPMAAPGERAIIYRSQPLISLLKGLNDYSNNIFDSLVDAIGGAGTVQAIARSRVPARLRGETVLADAAGTDPRNRLSPRAAVSLLRALERELAATGHSLCDVLPVAGVDTGTLEARLEQPGEVGRVVGKTGTYGSYGASGLVGAIRTRARGTVYFAILDHGVPVPEARRRQDRFVRALLAELAGDPWPYRRDPRPAVARAQIEVLDR